MVGAYYFIFRKKQKKTESTSSENSDVSGDKKPYVFARPQRYIINVIQDEKNIDEKKYYDIIINMTDLIKQLEQKDIPKEIKLEKVFFKDINFKEYKKNSFKQNETIIST